MAGCLDQFADAEIDLLVDMSAAAGRPLNWNVLTIDAAVPERVPRQLLACERARKAGGRIVALTMPILTPMNMSLGTFCALNLIPGWGETLALPSRSGSPGCATPPYAPRCCAAPPARRPGVFRRLADFGRYVIGDTYSDANAGADRPGRPRHRRRARAGAVRDARGDLRQRRAAYGAVADAHRQRPGVLGAARRTWEHEDVLLGGSDAGAHLDRMCGAPYTTRFLGDCLRGRKLRPAGAAP